MNMYPHFYAPSMAHNLPLPMTSRLIHPCYKPIIAPSGAEHSVWANLSSNDASSLSSHQHLVTAHANSIRIYSVNDQAELICLCKFDDLAGNVISLHVLPGGDSVDELLVGFSGLPRLSVVKLVESEEDGSLMLRASSIIDFTSSLYSMSMGANAPLLEEDLLVCVNSCTLGIDEDESSYRSRVRTVASVLGGGVSIAVFQVFRDQSGDSWSSDPYILNLCELSNTMGFLIGLTAPLSGTSVDLSASRSKVLGPNQSKLNPTLNETSICSGFGDILDIIFLSGYSSPTIAILHAPRGLTWTGRLSSSPTALAVTAISVAVEHKTSVILWSCGAVCNDSRYIIPVPQPLGGCLVFSPNVVSHIHHGTVCGCLALNGFAHTSSPPELLIDQSISSKRNRSKYVHSCLGPNPSPLPLLSTQFDGSQAAFVSPTIALVSDREGQLYSLELHPGSNEKRADLQISVVALNCMLSGAPSSFALSNISSTVAQNVTQLLANTMKIEDDKMIQLSKNSVGLLFSGSTVGESHLVAFSMDSIRLNAKDESSILLKREFEEYVTKNSRIKLEGKTEETSVISEEEDENNEEKRSSLIEDDIFLYNGYADQTSIVEETSIRVENEQNLKTRSIKAKRPIESMHTFILSILDSVKSFGCLGYSCQGPCYSEFSTSTVEEDDDETDIKLLNHDHIISCGAGKTGGIAIISSIGETETSGIISEIDFMGAKNMFLLKSAGTIVITKEEGTEPILLQKDTNSFNFTQVSTEDWCASNGDAKSMFDDPKSLFCLDLLSLTDVIHNGQIYIIAIASLDAEYAVVCLQLDTSQNKVCFCFSKLLESEGSEIMSLSINDEISNSISIVVVWSDGKSSFLDINTSSHPFDVQVKVIHGDSKLGKILASDIFIFDSNLFKNSLSDEDDDKVMINAKENIDFDEDLFDIYGKERDSYENCRQGDDLGLTTAAYDFESYHGTPINCAIICRDNGNLQIYDTNNFNNPVWEVNGCGMGLYVLDPKRPGQSVPENATVSEIRFFTAGPAIGGSGSRRLCFLTRMSTGDLQLYSARKQDKSMVLHRECTEIISRNSSEISKHRLKMQRKGLLSKETEVKVFQKNELVRFHNISCQSGLFFNGARPCWFVAERGMPLMLQHRLRFATPGVSRPILAFCADNQTGSFFTIHERLGRFGSQRLSVWDGLSDVFESEHGFLPGGGYFGRKIPLGVTVKKIEYINDESLASSGHPLYAMLVCCVTKEDQIDLNDDGLTDDERRRIQEEKEAEKTKRQVEADLGGYDIEEFEREDVFKIERKYGEAPPIDRERYEVWLVDANGWKVVDRFELDEYEHGLSLKVISLTEVQDDANKMDSESPLSKFIAVGTGKVDEDAEDSECVGRILLFEVVDKDGYDYEAIDTWQSVELHLAYEKAMQMGPVTCLTNLESDNKTRLVVGAGAEVTVEQWTGSNLLQVGFFHANMHVFNISLMKGFLLLSDAYDSLHFLVWRESDKSLTLLAKDYEPTAVYSSGILNRGGAMAFISHDDHGNIECLQYAPKDDAARGGNKLVRRADFHLGTQTISMTSYWCRSSLLSYTSNLTSTWAALQRQDALVALNDENRRFASSFGTVDGGLSSVFPVSEQVYWRMTALQSVMSNALQANCGLNFRAWRLFHRSSRRGACQAMERKKGFLDGSLLFKFSNLPTVLQEELASAIGSSVDVVLDNLLELDCASLV